MLRCIQQRPAFSSVGHTVSREAKHLQADTGQKQEPGHGRIRAQIKVPRLTAKHNFTVTANTRVVQI